MLGPGLDRMGCGIRWLGLADDDISDIGAEALIAALLDRPGKTRLNLYDNPIGPELRRAVGKDCV